MLRPTLILLAAASLHAEEVEPPRDDSWKLVWSDEFNTDGPPDPEVWEAERGFVRNEELQWYQPQNAFCRDGKLILEARRERVENPRHRAGARDWRRARPFADYTSASLITKPSLSWQYGRFEIRARFPAKDGLWPAIWTTGHGHWPAGGEIDIMEYYRGMILANFVQADERGRDRWNDSKHPIAKFDPETWDERFHLWVMEWTEDRIDIYLDGKLLNHHDLTKSFNGNDPKVNPFRAPHRLRLDLAVGGEGGDPSKTGFPQRYEIDYFRVYQKK